METGDKFKHKHKTVGDVWVIEETEWGYLLVNENTRQAYSRTLKLNIAEVVPSEYFTAFIKPEVGMKFERKHTMAVGQIWMIIENKKVYNLVCVKDSPDGFKFLGQVWGDWFNSIDKLMEKYGGDIGEYEIVD